MATTWSDIITAAMQVINDDRWQEQLANDPAQFFRAKSEMVKAALPLLKRPPELLVMLQQSMTLPSYADLEWVSTEASLTEATEIQTELYGYELMSCVLRVNDGTDILPYPDATYDADTGIITFPIQPDKGLEYEIDFYSDGTFADLTPSQLRLYSLAVAVVWDEHFTRNYLDMTMKIQDTSFSTVNEANYIDKSNRRLLENRQSFNDELKDYEQLCAYLNTVNLNGAMPYKMA